MHVLFCSQSYIIQKNIAKFVITISMKVVQNLL